MKEEYIKDNLKENIENIGEFNINNEKIDNNKTKRGRGRPKKNK